jgi:hypothetical protein
MNLGHMNLGHMNLAAAMQKPVLSDERQQSYCRHKITLGD